jgi:hypothetical protein
MYTRNGDGVGVTSCGEEEDAESAALGGGGHRCGDEVDQDTGRGPCLGMWFASAASNGTSSTKKHSDGTRLIRLQQGVIHPTENVLPRKHICHRKCPVKRHSTAHVRHATKTYLDQHGGINASETSVYWAFHG